MEVDFKSPSLEKTEAAETEVEENMHFHKSLQELRELQSQLHHAADYCETTFLKSEAKRDVLENTKEYICRVMVTVVDHLGNVSANLDGLISQTNAFSEAESKIQDSKTEDPSKLDDKHILEKHEDLPLFLYTQKPHGDKNLKPTSFTTLKEHNLTMVVPVRDGLSVLTKVSNPTFHFLGSPKVARHRRSLHGSNILWLIRRTKRIQ
ncbi:Protein ABIL1 [Glycine max]|nr:Protein ABIL1 [Glycine max]